jgi:hypothetical protein
MVVALGINADGEIVERELHHLASKVHRTACVIYERLKVGNEDGLVMPILERQTGAKGPGKMAEVEWAGQTIPGEYHLTVCDGRRRRLSHWRLNASPSRISSAGASNAGFDGLQPAG